jgi:hypothetical protein
MTNLVHNERVKMAAAAFANVGVAGMVAGVAIPLVTDQGGPLGFFLGMGVFCFFLFAAYDMLGKLRE